MVKLILNGCAVLALSTGMSLAQDLKFPVGEGAFSWDSYESFKSAHDLTGQTVKIFGPWRGDDQALFQSVFAYFEAATGAKVNYASSESYEQQIVIDIEAKSPPDLAILPQPGLIQQLVRQGAVTKLSAGREAWLRDNFAAGDSWVTLGTFAGPDGAAGLYALPYKIDVKSLVWYVPDNFADAGYEVPTTMEELKALTEQIVADGGTPWCIGLGSGGATGWPATDWVEDLMLRTQPAEAYDKWVSNELAFDSPEVIGALEEFGWFLQDSFVAGGRGAVASTDFRDSPKGLFSSPPQCYMHHQASFIPTFFPEGTEMGLDADFFYMPSYASKDLGNPVLGAGTLVFVTHDTPAAQAFLDFLQTPIAHELWMAQTGFLTPFKAANVETYGDETLKKMGQILLEATTFRFDGSDLMPAGVGAGSFWTGMVDFAGGKPAAEVGAAIQQSWGTLK